MAYTVIGQNELVIDLVEQARTTGWSVSDNIATHEICNAGSIFLEGQEIEAGQNYEVSYNILSIAGGSIGLKPFLGTAEGTARTTSGFYTETITAAGANPEFRFYSDADCSVEVFNIKNTLQSTDLKQRNTIAWSEASNKWTSFYTYNPDVAFSMFINLFTFKAGNLYIHRQNSLSRNNFFDTQYQTIFKFASNPQPMQTQTFQGITLQNNLLMITTTDGITTSLGQISELIELDFLKETLDDGVDTVNVYTTEGLYSASFMMDKNEDLINGALLKGTYITIELITAEEGALRLFSAAVSSARSAIGVR